MKALRVIAISIVALALNLACALACTDTPTPVPTPNPVVTPALGCAAEIVSPADGSTISGVVPFSVVTACAASVSASTPNLWYRAWTNQGTFDFGGAGDFEGASTTLDTTKYPNGPGAAIVVVYDHFGVTEEGRTAVVNFTVANAGGPTLTPEPTMEPTAVPTVISTPAPGGGNAMRANDFLNTMGAVTHDIQGGTNPASEIAAFNFTGLRLGRDDGTFFQTCSGQPAGTGCTQDLIDVHNGTKTAANPGGVMWDQLPFTCPIGASWCTNQDNPDTFIAITKANWDMLAQAGAFAFAEGPNEPNNNPFWMAGQACQSGNTFAGCAAEMIALRQMVADDPLLADKAVADISEPAAEPDNQGLQFIGPLPAGTLQPAGTVLADVANLHNYLAGGGITTPQDNGVWNDFFYAPPNHPYDDMLGEYCGSTWGANFPAAPLSQCGQIPVMTTETGWRVGDGGVDADTVGRMAVSVYLDAAANGYKAAIWYMLLDDANDGGYGLMNADGSPRAAGTYVHNLTTILDDTSSGFTPTPVSFSVSGLPATGHYLLMEKSTGAYDLVLWGEAFASHTSATVTVNLPSPVSARIYDVTAGTSPVQSVNASMIPVALSDHAMIVEWGGADPVSSPTSAPTAAPTPAPTSGPTQAPTAAPTPIQQATVCRPVWTGPTDPLHPIAVRGTLTLTFNPGCNGAWASEQLFIGCPDSPIVQPPANCSGWPFYQFPEPAGSSITLDTTKLQNREYDMVVGFYGPAGNLLGSMHDTAPAGTDGDLVLTVSN